MEQEVAVVREPADLGWRGSFVCVVLRPAISSHVDRRVTMPNEPMQYRLPEHEYTVDDDGGQQLSDEELRQEFEEWVAHCESNKEFVNLFREV
jgi:hypothetical protein